MKKILAALLALGLSVSLLACSNDKEDTDKLEGYVKEDVVITSVTIPETGEIFHFEAIDTETVAITGYEGSDRAHELKIPTELDGKRVTTIGKAAFYYCSKINSITIPETITIIDEAAFAGCALVTELNIPANVTTIGRAAFYGCIGLTKINFAENGNLNYIGEQAFMACTALTEIKIPSCVKTIDSGAFMNCTALKTVVLAEGVEKVGRTLFANCTAVNSLTLPASLKIANIGDFAFSGLPSLYSDGIIVPEGSEIAIYAEEVIKAPERIE